MVKRTGGHRRWPPVPVRPARLCGRAGDRGVDAAGGPVGHRRPRDPGSPPCPACGSSAPWSTAPTSGRPTTSRRASTRCGCGSGCAGSAVKSALSAGDVRSGAEVDSGRPDAGIKVGQAAGAVVAPQSSDWGERMLRQMERSTIHVLAKRGKSHAPDRAGAGPQPHHRRPRAAGAGRPAAGPPAAALAGRPVPAADRGVGRGRA